MTENDRNQDNTGTSSGDTAKRAIDFAAISDADLDKMLAEFDMQPETDWKAFLDEIGGEQRLGGTIDDIWQ